MKNVIFKAIFKKGTKGSKGDTGVNFVVPTGAIVCYDGADTPEGYEDTQAPEGFSMGSDIGIFKLLFSDRSVSTEIIIGGIN